ncbi:MAG: peptidoglycan editing factor PgeF [Proteobacteria bacterium]|nr:peptidoglycan editing factor PgeF [Pseudomonadota bacterium]NOG60111.1 peptidoglycan editing factor PgeF [Pseudomonadota bacterium]
MTRQKNNIWLDADWPAPKHIRAGTSLRTGGYSTAPYNEFNLALHVGDNPDDVKSNREILFNYLDLSSEPFWLEQTHSAKIISIDRPSANRKADASVTTQKNRVSVIMTADCVPILLCNKEGTKIAAVHAGWRGICGGIIENSLKAFSEPENLIAWIGPCISQKYYEVGTEVYENCLSHSKMLEKAFKQTNRNHWYANLVQIVRILMEKERVGSIHECGLCTYKLDDMFYSYRRDRETGRMASMIWME